jgi:hypothetical protein
MSYICGFLTCVRPISIYIAIRAIRSRSHSFCCLSSESVVSTLSYEIAGNFVRGIGLGEPNNTMYCKSVQVLALLPQ